MAYLRVHSRANSLYFSRSVLYILAISGTNGSSGFGSHSREHIDRPAEHCAGGSLPRS
ncbi:GSCOCG00002064001-RA-CDS [Cotesia congregata]|nr:GSCOCG00002064001-RA-CDS [Cotesia congregata]